MKRTDINETLKQYLYFNLNSGGEGVWPNTTPEGAMEKPYYEVAFIAQDRGVLTISGEALRETGRVQVTFVGDIGPGELALHNLVEEVEDLFPVGTQLHIPGGLISIPRPPEPRPGFRDREDWRVPVIIHYYAYSQ